MSNLSVGHRSTLCMSAAKHFTLEMGMMQNQLGKASLSQSIFSYCACLASNLFHKCVESNRHQIPPVRNTNPRLCVLVVPRRPCWGWKWSKGLRRYQRESSSIYLVLGINMCMFQRNSGGALVQLFIHRTKHSNEARDHKYCTYRSIEPTMLLDSFSHL